MSKLGDTQLNKELRQNKLEEILAEYDEKNQEPSKTEIQKELANRGYFISIPTLYADLKDIASKDPFIQELASKTYSSIMHTAYNRYEKIYRLAMNIHDSENQLTRDITRISDKDSIHETIKDKSGAIKLQALTVAKNAQDSIRLMVNGENLHKSASKWIEVTKQQESTINRLREELTQIKNKGLLTPGNTENQ